MNDVLNKNRKKTFLLIAVLFILGVMGVLFSDVFKRNSDGASIVERNKHVLNIKIGDGEVHADIADTENLRERGLSGRTSLLPSQGMYFIFETAAIYPFWMKEMNFPIDIIWIGDDLHVVDTTEGATPESFPQTFVSKSPARYVLEVNSGFVREHGVKIGDIAELIF